MLMSICVRSAVAANLRTARARTTCSITTQLSLTYRTLCGLRMIPRISAGSWALPARRRALATTALLTVRTLVMPTLPLRMASCRATTTGHSQSTFRPQSSRLAIQARYHSRRSRNCAMGTMHRQCTASRCAYSASGLHQTTSAFFLGRKISVVQVEHSRCRAHRIKASVAYIPVVWPPPLPVPSQTPPGGKQSPHGALERWHALAPVRVMGTRTRTRTNVEIGCTVRPPYAM